MIPQKKILSDFEDLSRWNNIGDGFGSASLDPTILLDNFCIPNDECNAIAEGISQGTTSVLTNGFFCRKSLIGPSGTSAVIVAPAIDYEQNLCAIGTNWVTDPTDSQLSYRSELAGIIVALYN